MGYSLQTEEKYQRPPPPPLSQPDVLQLDLSDLLPPDGDRSPRRPLQICSPAPTKTIAELAIATPALSTLLAAVKAAGLVETLSGEGPFTVFAPTNDAFAKIPTNALNGLLADKDALTAVLLRHVVPGAALKARDVPHGTTPVKTAGGEEIQVTKNRYISVKSSAGKAGVIAFDILATNGVVHLVNSVF